ncbi:WD repeat-containing protein 6 isoform X2 [Zeugodacus cucurbitae]|uniref:WD repeat-containing protein 6 isoform X2 n=1 Tax=Zeugodacus cucurbitae TaxID=28588 RepID=UPI0023D94680|nr:WD repeat-containing protein 6 isoform X2 [Zeugodacus cucurbitae]
MEAELTITDSIAIKILHGGAILTGVGNELHLHLPKSSKSLVLAHKLRAKVHGIADVLLKSGTSNEGRIIIHGEKECMLMQYIYEEYEYTFKELSHFRLTDWISSARFLLNPNEFVLLTSHSVVLRFKYEENAGQGNSCKVTAKSSSSDKSTLYCSHIRGRIFEDLVIFGGNAFGELLIWKPFVAETISPKRDCIEVQVELKHRQPAHNGVIFSIDFDDESDLLTTTSDDRSIRFWKLEKITENSWNDINLNAIASGYGHVARVFQGKIIHCDGKPMAVTVGEDSHFCIWNNRAELLFKQRIQYGAVIWNFEYDKYTHSLYTVGSTGNLLAYNVEDVLKRKSELFSTTIIAPDLEPKEYVTKAKFIESNMLVGITNRNRLMHARLLYNEANNTHECGAWHIIDINKNYKCTALEVQDNYIAICGYKRLTLIKYCHESEFVILFDDDILDGVIRSFHFLNNNSFLISDETGKCLLLEDENLLVRIAVPLPHCKEPWTTTALRIQMKGIKDYLLVSNRMGNTILFNIDYDTAGCTYLDTIRHLHGPLGATMFRLQEVQKDEIFIQSSGHDGTLRLLCITKESDTIAAHQRTFVPVAWVEQLILIENNEFLLGFNDNHFVIWSHDHDISVQIPCGGGHRSWHYNVTSDAGKKFVQLVFIKNKELRLHKHKLCHIFSKCKKILRNQWHTRSCNILSLVEPPDNSALHFSTLVSAGDDNVVKISKLTTRGRLEQCAELHSHISNVRALKILQVQSDTALIFTGGGRAQLCIALLDLKTFRVQELVSYTLHNQNAPNDKTHAYRSDPETRIMSCDVVKMNSCIPDNNVEYLVFLCCSDGYLRKVHFSESFKVLSEFAFYYGCCPLQVRAFANSYVLIAGTNGKLRLFYMSLVELPIELLHHASGVNAMDIYYEDNTCMLHILTGGDDQSVSYTSLEMHNKNTFQVKNTFCISNAHSAQVTAAQFTFDDETLCGYTSGLDQVVNKIHLQNPKAEFISYTSISDTKGLRIDNSKRCYVYGCGIQVFKLK